MKAFAALYRAVDESTATNDKVAALEHYFRTAPPADAAWALHVLLGNRPKRLIGSAAFRDCLASATALPAWLIDASYEQVGDLAETAALLVNSTADRGSEETPTAGGLRYWIEERLLPLRELDDPARCSALQETWRALSVDERFVWNKLLTGAFRVGVAAGLVTRAVARAAGLDDGVIAHRLMGTWQPTIDAWTRLIEADASDTDASRPYPFALASPLADAVDDLGPMEEWLAEWKWDGIRAQLVRRNGTTWLWSRGEELLAGRFPEIELAATHLPDGTVLDGEILAWLPSADVPMPFAQMQRRIHRKALSKAMLASVPVVFLAFDMIEEDGADLREIPLAERRARLETLLRRTGNAFRVSPALDAPAWPALAEARSGARAIGAEGLMLKRRDGAYPRGRRRGGWWKWKLDPLSVDAVLVAAQGGSGRRAGLFTDYTFAVRDGDKLVSFAKAYSGLTDQEIRQVDAFVRKNTLERFGPVRTVAPELVFEIAFEGIQLSTRHKSGVAVRFPRIARWRTDKTPADADTIEAVRALIDQHG